MGRPIDVSHSSSRRPSRFASLATLDVFVASVLGFAACQQPPAVPAPVKQEQAQPPPANAHCDMLVIYSHTDQTWAESTLIRMLKERGVQTCAGDVDVEVVPPRLTEIEHLMSVSRYTVVVLTPRFPKAWFAVIEAASLPQDSSDSPKHHVVPLVREPCEMSLLRKIWVSLDMTADDSVASGVERLVKALRTSAGSASPNSTTERAPQ